MQAWVFPGLVVIARAKHPAPFRTRPLSAAAPMVLRLKTWESKSPPDLVKNIPILSDTMSKHSDMRPQAALRAMGHKHGAGWSSPVARQAHNLKVAGSNPAPATTLSDPLSFEI